LAGTEARHDLPSSFSSWRKAEMNNNLSSTIFSGGSCSGVPGQMWFWMLWMWPREGTV